MSTRIVPFLTISIANFNPNHKYRFLALMPSLRWFADLAFAGRDDSIYIAPRLQQHYMLVGQDCGGNAFETSVDPSQDLHVSLHHSGVVNLTIGERRFEIGRQTGVPALRLGQIVTFGIKNVEGLQSATQQDVNSLPARYSVVPLAGFLALGPAYLTIFRVPISQDWAMPQLSDTFQVHVECRLQRKNVKYEFVVWQNSGVPSWPGDVAISV
jgi:hypothetical protein